jgi:hypothetical protein
VNIGTVGSLASLVALIPLGAAGALILAQYTGGRSLLRLSRGCPLDLVTTTSDLPLSKKGPRVRRATTGHGQVQGIAQCAQCVGHFYWRRHITVYMSRQVTGALTNDLVILGRLIGNEIAELFTSHLCDSPPPWNSMPASSPALRVLTLSTSAVPWPSATLTLSSPPGTIASTPVRKPSACTPLQHNSIYSPRGVACRTRHTINRRHGRPVGAVRPSGLGADGLADAERGRRRGRAGVGAGHGCGEPARRRAWADIEARHGMIPGAAVADKVLDGVTRIRLDAADVPCRSQGRNRARFQGVRPAAAGHQAQGSLTSSSCDQRKEHTSGPVEPPATRPASPGRYHPTTLNQDRLHHLAAVPSQPSISVNHQG